MRFAEGRPERLPGLVDELIRLGVDVLVVGSTIGARAAKAATTTLPVVFAGSSDPVAGNIVKTLARPGGNLTGTSLAYGDGIAGKWLELLVEMTHAVSPCSVLWSSSNTAGARFVEELRAAARKLDVRLDPHHATNVGELDDALVAVRSSGARSLIVTPSPFWVAHQRRLLRLAEDHRLPTMHFDEDFVGAGGLMSYGPSIAEAYRRAATHVDRILRGANPGDLPVEQPTQFDLVVNARTAKALGLTVTQSMLIRARVIE
jgi:putative ABC transport system substrate-binding protein